MVTPIVPSHNLIFILVDLGVCAVARYVEVDPFNFKYERAANWEELEPAARAEVIDQVGAITGDDHLPCSPELAGRALWNDDDSSSGG